MVEMLIKKDSVQSFFDTLYGNNKLLTHDAWRHHNEVIPEAVANMKETFGISDEDFILIPVGSSLTLPAANSDIDCYILRDDKLVKNSMFLYYLDDEGKVEVIGEEFIYDYLNFFGVQKKFDSHLFCAIMLVPDDLVQGNLVRLAEVRLELINILSALFDEMGERERSIMWNNIMNKPFQKNIWNWETSLVGKYHKSGDDRREYRYSDLLEMIYINNLVERGEDYAIRWQNAFNKFKDRGLEPPCFEDLKEYLIQNNGKISLNCNRFSNIPVSHHILR